MSITASSQNQFIDVATLAEKSTPFLPNTNCWVGIANRKYDGIQGIPGQLGATVNIRTPIQVRAPERSVVWNTQPWVQQLVPLSVDKQFSQSISVATTQYMFNAEDFLQTTARPLISSIGDEIGKEVSEMIIQKAYRFYGSTTQPFRSQNDLGEALSQFRNYGAANMNTTGVLWDMTTPNIISGQSNLFTPGLNDEYANSWQLANRFGNCKWVETNIVAKHIAGSEGQAASTLTVVSVTRDADGRINTITFSGTSATNDSHSIKAGDKLYVIPTDGYETPYFYTYNNKVATGNVVQLSALTDASAAGGQVTVTLNQPMSSSDGVYPANMTTDIVAGMRFKVLDSFRATAIMSGDPLYVAIPPIPQQDPFQSHVATDEESNVSMMFSAGWPLGTGQYKFGYTCVAGYTVIPQQIMLLIQPL